MSSARRVTIIGAGIGGLCIAYRFLQAGFGVQLINRPDEISASRIASGISFTKGTRLPRDPAFALKVEGHARLEKLLRELRVPFERRIYEPFLSTNDYSAIRKRSFAGFFSASFGVDRLDFRSKDERPSFFSEKVRGAFVYPKELAFDANSLLDKLYLECLTLGMVNVISSVHAFERSNSHWIVHYLGGSIRSDELIIAAGPSTPVLLQLLKIRLGDFELSPGTRLRALNEESVFSCVVKLNSSALLYPGHTFVYSRADVTNHSDTHHGLGLHRLDIVEAVSANRVAGKFPIFDFFPCEGGGRVGVCTSFYRSGFQYADIAAQKLVSLV